MPYSSPPPPAAAPPPSDRAAHVRDRPPSSPTDLSKKSTSHVKNAASAAIEFVIETGFKKTKVAKAAVEIVHNTLMEQFTYGKAKADFIEHYGESVKETVSGIWSSIWGDRRRALSESDHADELNEITRRQAISVASGSIVSQGTAGMQEWLVQQSKLSSVILKRRVADAKDAAILPVDVARSEIEGR